MTERLRREGVAGEFVEFFGAGVGALGAGGRAVVANMAPEYGATTGYFPIDAAHAHLSSLRRAARRCRLNSWRAYARAQGLWYMPDAAPRYTRVIEIDLSAVRLSLAGPRRPQDRIDPGQAPSVLRTEIRETKPPASPDDVPSDAVAIAAITSCTNTTDFGLLVAAGIVARNARRLGLSTLPWVKTSLTPGSPAAARRLGRIELLDDLDALGFGIAGFGCATCIGNSGPLLPRMTEAISRRGIKPIAVLSGNRNFPGRVHAQIDAALLASPPLVIAYALAGRALLGCDKRSDRYYAGRARRSPRRTLATPRRGGGARGRCERSRRSGSSVYGGRTVSPVGMNSTRRRARAFAWDPHSTYLRRPPFVRSQGRGQRRSDIVAAPAPSARRRRDHRPHLACRRDSGGERGRTMARRSRRRPDGPECLCLAPWKLGGHAARPFHES